LAAILDIQNGSHSIIILLYTMILLIIKNMIACNLEESLYGIFGLEVAILKMVS